MVKILNVDQLDNLVGGGTIDSFCAGWDAVAGVYAVGVWANWWNPVGWGATVAGGIITGGCIVYQLQ